VIKECIPGPHAKEQSTRKKKRKNRNDIKVRARGIKKAIILNFIKRCFCDKIPKSFTQSR
jgi:hypothetical protein